MITCHQIFLPCPNNGEFIRRSRKIREGSRLRLITKQEIRTRPKRHWDNWSQLLLQWLMILIKTRTFTQQWHEGETWKRRGKASRLVQKMTEKTPLLLLLYPTHYKVSTFYHLLKVEYGWSWKIFTPVFLLFVSSSKTNLLLTTFVITEVKLWMTKVKIGVGRTKTRWHSSYYF